MSILRREFYNIFPHKSFETYFYWTRNVFLQDKEKIKCSFLFHVIEIVTVEEQSELMTLNRTKMI